MLRDQRLMAHAAPRPETGYGLPSDVSLDGWRIDWLIDVTLVAITVLFAIMVVWMLAACLRHGRAHAARYDHGLSRRSIAAKIAVSALIFFGVDGNLFVNSTRDLGHNFWNFAHAEAQPGALRIEVNAHQWAWDARYAGPDGKFNTRDDIVTLNDIRVPVDTPVLLQLASTDVIHCLYIPNVRVKQDVVPGMINRAWFQATRTGEFDTACAQHCGVNHYKMRGQLTVLSRADYERWAAAASDLSARAFDPDDAEAHWGWEWK
jgi:cytochrome c oxidase subunit 2